MKELDWLLKVRSQEMRKSRLVSILDLVLINLVLNYKVDYRSIVYARLLFGEGILRSN